VPLTPAVGYYLGGGDVISGNSDGKVRNRLTTEVVVGMDIRTRAASWGWSVRCIEVSCDRECQRCLDKSADIRLQQEAFDDVLASRASASASKTMTTRVLEFGCLIAGRTFA